MRAGARSPHELAEIVVECGGFRPAARALGVSDSTVRRQLAAAGLIEQVRERLASGSRPSPLRERRLDDEIRALRKRVKELEGALAEMDGLVERVVEAARAVVAVPSFVPPERPRKRQRERHTRAVVAPIFDCQYGQRVARKDVPFGRGGFDPDVFRERLELWFDRVSRLLTDRAAVTDYSELVVVLGGDLVEGDEVYRGQPWQLALDPVRQVLELRELLGAALGALVEHARGLGCRRFRLFAVPGNHGKVGGKKAGATPASYSWDYLLCELLRDRLDGVFDEVSIEQSGAVRWESEGWRFLAVHGDEIRGWGGIPFYGLTRFDGRAIRLSGEVFDYCLLGHHHQPATIPNGSGGEFIVSGDWVGGTNLSRSIVAASRPQQRVLLVARKHGVTTDERIFLDG